MASQETIYGLIVFAIGQGAGGATLEESAAAYLADRGYAWIVTAQPGRGAPQASWNVIGAGILDRCRAIGALSAALSGGAPIEAVHMESACLQIESESGTPWCPSAQT